MSGLAVYQDEPNAGESGIGPREEMREAGNDNPDGDDDGSGPDDDDNGGDGSDGDTGGEDDEVVPKALVRGGGSREGDAVLTPEPESCGPGGGGPGGGGPGGGGPGGGGPGSGGPGGSVPIDWGGLEPWVRHRIRRGRRLFPRNVSNEGAASGLSLSDAIQQAIADCLASPDPPTNHAEACQRVLERATRIWRTHLETSLRRQRTRDHKLANDPQPTPHEVFEAAVSRGDSAYVIRQCLVMIQTSNVATQVYAELLHSRCEWSDNDYLQRKLGYKSSEIKKAKNEIVRALSSILGSS